MRTRELGLSLVNNPLTVSPFSEGFSDGNAVFPPPGTQFITTEGGTDLTTEGGVYLTTE